MMLSSQAKIALVSHANIEGPECAGTRTDLGSCCSLTRGKHIVELDT